MREWVFAIIGGIIFIIAVIVRIKTAKKDNICTEHVTAEIVEVRKYKDTYEDDRGRTHKDYSYHPVYHFTVNGKGYDVWSQYGCGKAGKFVVGNTEKIMYNPKDPKQISTKISKKANRQFSFFLMFVGLLFIAVNILVVVKS